MDGWMDGMDGRTDGRTDRQTDRLGVSSDTKRTGKRSGLDLVFEPWTLEREIGVLGTHLLPEKHW